MKNKRVMILVSTVILIVIAIIIGIHSFYSSHLFNEDGTVLGNSYKLYYEQLNNLSGDERIKLIEFGVEQNIITREEADKYLKENEFNVDDKLEEKKSVTIEKEVYTNALKNLYENGVLPDGTTLEEYNLNYDMSENKFAISDIDLDGKDELIIALVQSPMASMRTIIYDYDMSQNKFIEQLREFPDMTFYDNRMIVVNWSHNQGSAGDALWPYTLYRYIEENDCYEVLAMVDAWDKSVSEKCYIEEEFPKEIDKDGDGIIYYVLQENYIAYDLEEYEKWRMQYITEDTSKVIVSYMNITEENISKIVK